MSGVMDFVMDRLGGSGIGAIAEKLGVDEEQAKGAVETTLGVLSGAMARNASDGDGAAKLDAALEKDHDGGIFDDIGGFLGNLASGPGAGILGHVLGGQQNDVAQGIAEQSGLSMDKVQSLLVMVAPLLMGALGKKKRDEGLDASGVADAVVQEKEQAASKGGLGGLLDMVGGFDGLKDMAGAITGGDGDGGSSKSGGILGSVSGMLGGLFGKKKGS